MTREDESGVVPAGRGTATPDAGGPRDEFLQAFERVGAILEREVVAGTVLGGSGADAQ